MSNRELHYMGNPLRTRLAWTGLYATILIVSFAVFYLIVGRMRTHTIPVGKIELAVPYSKYLLGETVTFTVKNKFNSSVYALNRCPNEPLGVYRQDDGKWVRIHDQATEKDCTSQQRQVSIPSGGSMTVSLAPWKHLFEKPAKYRVVLFVEYYNELPYQEFEIITAPIKAVSQSDSASTVTGSASTTQKTTPRASTNTTPPVQKPPAVTHIVNVNSSGNYDITSLTLNSGDSIKFVYKSPIGNEVRTSFSPSTISPLTLDEDTTSGTQTFNIAGKWTFKADDHNGNTVSVTVQ